MGADGIQADVQTVPDGAAIMSPATMASAGGEQNVVADRRRALLYLGICIAFGAALLLPMLSEGAAGNPPDPCGDGSLIAQVAVMPAGPTVPPRLFAILRPPAYPGVVQGHDPGCESMYRSDDNGLTWTISFSATAEAPAAIVQVADTEQAYLMTIRMHFPLYAATNIYRSDAAGTAWTWTRISPQQRRDVPVVMATDMLVGNDGSVILREGNGDGAALVRSIDGGRSWRALTIPQLVSVGTVTLLDHLGQASGQGRPLIAVTPPSFQAMRPPGLASEDGGQTWRSLGPLPGAPVRRDLQPVLTADTTEGALVLDLITRSNVMQQHTVVRYASLDGGRTWRPVHCGVVPAPGCAPPARWARVGNRHYVLYHGRIFQKSNGRPWQPLPGRLPVRSGSILQLLAAPGMPDEVLYLVTPLTIWRLEHGVWQSSARGLPVALPTATNA